MKKQNWLYFLLILLTLAVLLGYQAMSRLSADTQAPVITVSGEMPRVSVLDEEDALLSGVTAADNVDGDVTASLLVESLRLRDPDGTVDVACAAFDKAGNVARLTRQAQFTDYTSPRFSLSQPLLFTQSSNFDVLSIISAQDTLDGNIQHRIRATSLDDTAVSTLGSHELQFRVTNSLGDTVELVLPVEVYSTNTYDMTLTLSDYLIYLEKGSHFDARSYLISATENLTSVSLSGSTPANYAVKITGTVDTATPGVYAVDYVVTHTLANTQNPENSRVYTGFTRLIVVVEG